MERPIDQAARRILNSSTMSWFACNLAVHQDYPDYFYKDSGNGTTSNPRRNIVVGNFVSRVPVEAEMITQLDM
jgi:hypothetical protein